MVLRRFWKQYFPRRDPFLECLRSALVSQILRDVHFALRALFTEGGEEKGKSVPLVRGADRSSLGPCQTLGPRDAKHYPR